MVFGRSRVVAPLLGAFWAASCGEPEAGVLPPSSTTNSGGASTMTTGSGDAITGSTMTGGAVTGGMLTGGTPTGSAVSGGAVTGSAVTGTGGVGTDESSANGTGNSSTVTGSGGSTTATTGATTTTGGSTGTGACSGGSQSGRFMECLGRGVVAVPAEGGVFVSWRLFGTDPADVGFNLYAQDGTATPRLVCSTDASHGTWCLDDEASSDTSYFVRAVLANVEQEPSAAAPRLAQDYLRIPLEPASNDAYVHLGWVGDLDGDGELDFVVDRISAAAPLVDGYARDGRFLWRLDTGPLGTNQDNIEGGASTISNGHWDGLTIFDFDSNGRAEVAIKTANGFVFGDGSVLSHDNDEDQFVSVLEGETGRELARAPLPDDTIDDGPLQCHFGAGYLDGVHPSVVVKCKNRVGDGAFNLVAAAYDFDGTMLTRRWKYTRGDGSADFHQIRILDVDGDGRDELADGGYVIDDDGTLLYSLSESGVVHGDRFHITDMDPERPGLEGWGIQQDNANGLETYYYDAATGEVLRTYSNQNGPGGDMGRGTVADLFPDRPGLEYWSFNGMYSAPSGELVVQEVDRNVPWPNFSMQWDGDTGSELLDNNQVGDWDLAAQSRNSYSWRRSFDGLVQARGAIPFYGDVLGDWRDEALLESSDHSELRVYTTTYSTELRLYTPLHNPAYRNSLAVHGYKQSHLVDYYLGFSMSPPSSPNIRLAPRQ